MQAIQRVKYSEDCAAALELRTVPKATLKDAEHVLVRVASVSINPVDVKLTAGWFAAVQREQLPRTIGFDVAGVVVEVGASVTELSVGDAVFGDVGVFCQETFAEFVSAPARKFARKPANISFDEAASIPLAGLSALDALLWAQVAPGQTVVVRGASSGVGTLAVQIARIMGAARVIGISSREKLCKDLGCDEVVNYRTHKWEELLKGRNVDVFFDAIGGENVFEFSKAVLKPSGAFVTVAGDRQSALSFGSVANLVAYVVSRKLMSWVSRAPYFHYTMKAETPAKMAQLASWLADGQLRAVLDAGSPLPFTRDGALAAAQKMNDGSAGGKVVLRVWSP